MKKSLFTAAFILSTLCLHAADITMISKAFSAGNATPLAANMDTEIDLALQDKAQKANAAEAVAQLNRFFEANKPTAFTVAHNADKNETGFLVGKLATGKGEFRVNITYIMNDDNIIIQSIRIE
ncbi:MAG: DUF4783 domain-containing protein [Tannerella sp.]|nr:DUF4783 domain-containing protein [Tannerella sp.]